MMKLSQFMVAVGLLLTNCSTKDQHSESMEIPGAYSREHSFKVVKQETGEEIGMRTVRDTVFIEVLNDGYRLSNHKWMLNDYDAEGWRNMMHSDDRPFQPHTATLNSAKSTLESDGFPVIHVEDNGLQIYLGEPSKIYQKVK